MDPAEAEAIRSRAVELVRSHLDYINRDDLVAARQQLFVPPGTAHKPVEVYLRTMRDLAPFEVISAVATDFEDVREKRHGAVATVTVSTSVGCAIGVRMSDIIVWWFPGLDQCLISARPTPWVVEKLRMDG